jgi:transposase-like protein
LLPDDGPLALEIPRERAGTFEPLWVGKHQRRFTGFDDRIIALYARGMAVREIQKHLEELYAVEVSPQLISEVTEAVMNEVVEWRNRPLEPLYPVVFFDCPRVKIRDQGVGKNKAVYLALGILPDGARDVLGLWIEQTEGAKFWLKVFNELRNRGVEDILVAVVDGLKGFPEAIETVFPATTVQTCIVHLIRNSTTNAIESLHMRLRKAIKTRGRFPCDEAAAKLIWLALRNITADWSRAAREWRAAMNQFAIMYPERFTGVVG